MPDADDDGVECDRHGPGRMAFVCRHLAGGSRLGFYHSNNGPYPDAWCGDWEAVSMRTGH